MTDARGARATARRDRVEPLWDRIDANRLKVAAFVATFILAAGASAAIIVALGGLFLGVALVSPSGFDDFFAAYPYMVGAALALGAGAAAVHVARMLSGPEKRLPRQFGATRSETGTMLPTKSALHDMAIAAGSAHSPQLWVIDDCDRINAFAVGLNERDAIIGVTRGLAERLDPDDQRAVFANLMARLRAGDTMSATVISTIMGPIWAYRASELRKQELREQDPAAVLISGSTTVTAGDRSGGIVAWFLLSFAAVILTELMMAGHERAALATAEKADAEGMLLLKDPNAMLRGLERTLMANNTVPGAGEEYSMLFFCWAGFGYAPEDDPEMERIGRLREVLGAEGSGAIRP